MVPVPPASRMSVQGETHSEDDEKARLVVLNEHTLGIINPAFPDTVNHLHASVLKGATNTAPGASSLIGPSDTVRLASAADFDNFRVRMDGYLRSARYIYARTPTTVATNCDPADSDNLSAPGCRP